MPANHSIDTPSERMISIQRPLRMTHLQADQRERQQEHPGIDGEQD